MKYLTRLIELVRPRKEAKDKGIGDGQRDYPGPKSRNQPPAIREQSAFGSVKEHGHGADYCGKVPALETPIHVAHHERERAALATAVASQRLDEKKQALDQHRERPEVARHGTRRGLPTLMYWPVQLVLAIGETFINLSAFYVLGEAQLRVAAAIGVGLALLILAKAIGDGLKAGSMDEPAAPHPAATAFFAVIALTLIGALAVLRARALSELIVQALGDASANSVPQVSWIPFFLLQMGIFTAAAWSSWRHSNWLADEDRQLVRNLVKAERVFSASLDREKSAADSMAGTEVAFASNFNAEIERALESAAWNIANQYHYWSSNVKTRTDPDSAPIATDPVAAGPWREAPSARESLIDRLPKPSRVWLHPVGGIQNRVPSQTPNRRRHEN